MKNALSKLFSFLGKGNSENGQPSSIRIFAFYAHLLLVPAFTFAMIYAVIVGRDVVALSGILVGYLLGIAGIKAYQKKDEVPIDCDKKI